MITWMQRRKKYLVVILWVTVISFVGAGFVGWGSYNYGSKASNIAKVGDIDVTIGEFQHTYSNIYSYYNQLLEGKVTEDQKRELQQVAINNLINRALLLSYANELGLKATDEEVSARVIATQMFQKDGKFDKELYISTISRNGYKIADYEDTIRKDLIVTKLSELLSIAPTDLEMKVFTAPKDIKDKLMVKVLDSKGMDPKISEGMMKEYYDSHKSELIGEPTFDISFIKVTKENVKITEPLAKEHYEKNKTEYLDKNGNVKSYEKAKNDVLNDLADKITRKEALKASVAWKKGEMKPTTVKNLPVNNTVLPIAVMKNLDEQASVKISKPMKINGGYVVYKVEKRNPPKQLTLKEAQKEVTYRLKNQEVSRIIAAKANDALKNLKGQTTDFLGLGDSKGIKNLDEEETSYFIQTLFSKDKKEGVINVGSKAVVYKILEQKLFDEKLDKDDLSIIKSNVERMKSDSILEDLIAELKNRYKIETYTQP